MDLQCCDGSDFSLVSAGKDGAIIFWKIVKTIPDDGGEAQLAPEIVGQLMHPNREQGGEDLFYTSVRYHAAVQDGRGAAPAVVALDTSGKVTLWPGAYQSTAPVELTCAEEGAVFTAISISPGGETIAAATSMGMVVVWAAGPNGFAVAKKWKAHASGVFSLSFGPASAKQSMISASSGAGELKVWDAASWACLQTVSVKADTYDRVAVTAENSVLFLASSKSSSLVACHVGKYGLLDHATKCNIGQQILSFTAETDADSINLFGVQTSAIQQFTIASENCRPPPGLVSEPEPARAPAPAPAPARQPAAAAARPASAPPAAVATAGGASSPEVMAAIQDSQQKMVEAMVAVSARVDAGFQQFAKQQAAAAKQQQQANAALKKQILEGVAPVLRKELQATLPSLLKSRLQEAVSQAILPAMQKSASDSAATIAGGLQNPMQDAFRAGIIESVLPALEGAIQQAFVAVNETLDQGLTTCLKEPVETHLQQLQSMLASSMAKAESASALAAPVPEAAPLPPPDPKEVIESLLQSEDYEQAFVEALSARSVPLIIWMLGLLDPSVALANLTQVVLISLVQQLGHDMAEDIVRANHPASAPAPAPAPVFSHTGSSLPRLCARAAGHQAHIPPRGGAAPQPGRPVHRRARGPGAGGGQRQHYGASSASSAVFSFLGTRFFSVFSNVEPARSADGRGRLRTRAAEEVEGRQDDALRPWPGVNRMHPPAFWCPGQSSACHRIRSNILAAAVARRCPSASGAAQRPPAFRSSAG